MKKSLGVLSRSCSMAEYYGQIMLNLFGECADIYCGATDDRSIVNVPECELYIISITSYDMLQDTWIQAYMPAADKIVRMDLTFSKAVIDLLQTYPDGTRALLFNQTKHMAMECIAQLYHLGISNIEFFPFYPGADDVPEAEMVFTVGEHPVDAGDKRVIDIGSRKPTANVICEIALKLDQHIILEGKKFKRYRQELASVDYSLQKISSASLLAENRLELVLNSLDEGALCVDEGGLIKLVNKTAKKLLGITRADVVNRQVSDILPGFLLSDQDRDGQAAEPNRVSIQGKDYDIVITPFRLHGKSLGYLLSLYESDKARNEQDEPLRERGKKTHTAKHRFDDVIGTSSAMCKAKAIAQRMSTNDAAVMLIGDSGTGKSLIAQAIHNASDRAAEAFVTLNCMAQNDEPFEMKLFGCADDYHSAHPGNQTGLLEYAHNGTLFLENVEALTLGQQAVIFRILREREFTKIGSDEPIPIDIRIISSTNEEILRKVQEGEFRSELYYHLNVIPITIPPLRERKTDIMQLVEYFRVQMGADFKLTSNARLALLRHTWMGNVQELKNCIEYLKYTALDTVDCDDLPEAINDGGVRLTFSDLLKQDNDINMNEYNVLKALCGPYCEKRGMGRQAIADMCVVHGGAMSEHEVRIALSTLSSKGYVDVKTGRGGSSLTESGYLLIRRIMYGEDVDE